LTFDLLYAITRTSVQRLRHLRRIAKKRVMKILGIIAIVVALLLSSVAVVVAASSVEVRIHAPDEVAPGSDFTAGISVSEVVDFDGCQYDVSFDASVLRLDDVTSGLIGSTTIPVDLYWEVSPGTWRVVQSIPGATGASGSGYLAVLHFHATGSEDDSSVISLPNSSLYDTLAEEITAIWAGDLVDVASVDTTPPTVVSTSPEADAICVDEDTPISATFSDVMDASTITAGSFTLVTNDTPVSGSVSYNSITYTATFTPDVDLAGSTIYTVTLSTAITDAAGNPLASAYSWSFTTAVAVSPAVAVGISSPAEVGTDSDFTAKVYISEVTDFDACQYDVTFDASVFRLDDITSGLIGSTTIPVDIYNEISTGTYRVVQNVPGLDGATGSGYLAVLHFHVIGSEGDSSTINLSNGMLSNVQADWIVAVWSWHSVDVTSVLQGDANGDGVINALDITKVERIIAFLDPLTPGSDANQDGYTNALDITATERTLAGMD